MPENSNKEVNRKIYRVQNLVQRKMVQQALTLAGDILSSLKAMPRPKTDEAFFTRAKQFARLGNALRLALDPRTSLVAFREWEACVMKIRGDLDGLDQNKAKTYALISKTEIRLDEHKAAVISAQNSVQAWHRAASWQGAKYNLDLAKSYESLWNASMAADGHASAVEAAMNALSKLDHVEVESTEEANTVRARVF